MTVFTCGQFLRDRKLCSGDIGSTCGLMGQWVDGSQGVAHAVKALGEITAVGIVSRFFPDVHSRRGAGGWGAEGGSISVGLGLGLRKSWRRGASPLSFKLPALDSPAAVVTGTSTQ